MSCFGIKKAVLLFLLALVTLPVLAQKTGFIGLAFDGNKESLASNYQAVSGYNMCVCVDIRYVL